MSILTGIILSNTIHTIQEITEPERMEDNDYGIPYINTKPYCGRWVTEESIENGTTVQRHFRSWCAI